MAEPDSVEDILNDSLIFRGGREVADDVEFKYGPLSLSVAPKEGKANTLLADHIFSPALLLAELVERDSIPVRDRTVIELGAGCALPSLLMATLPEPPRLVVVTDYPDPIILGNLRNNVERNKERFAAPCKVQCRGYEWGKDVTALTQLSTSRDADGVVGYDIVILSDLLHFHSCHDVLMSSLTALLSKRATSRGYVAVGKYTASHICDHFLRMGERAGLDFEEGDLGLAEIRWLGTLEVGGLNEEQLADRKLMCRWWVCRWSSIDAVAS